MYIYTVNIWANTVNIYIYIYMYMYHDTRAYSKYVGSSKYV